MYSTTYRKHTNTTYTFPLNTILFKLFTVIIIYNHFPYIKHIRTYDSIKRFFYKPSTTVNKSLKRFDTSEFN